MEDSCRRGANTSRREHKQKSSRICQVVDTYRVDTYRVDTYRVDTNRVDTYSVDTYRVDTYSVDTYRVDTYSTGGSTVQTGELIPTVLLSTR
jgi:hypothetical protein